MVDNCCGCLYTILLLDNQDSIYDFPEKEVIMNATIVTIISAIIGAVVSVVAMFILMVKFVKEPLDKRMDEQHKDIVEIRSTVNKLYEMLLAHFMGLDTQSKGHRGEQRDKANIKE